MKKRVLSLEFEGGHWSWGVISKHLREYLHNDIPMHSLDFNEWRKAGRPDMDEDLILSQNVVQLEYLYDKDKTKTIARMGGNRSFDDRPFPQVQRYLDQMKQCWGVVATNQHLADIGKLVNPNTHLITNGINLKTWRPQKSRVFRHMRPIVGFIGNVLTQEKAEYKCYPQVQLACAKLGLTLKTALYRQKQIPHQYMMRDFYYVADMLVIPTAGEGTSNSIMEALSCGVPVITTKCAGYHGEQLEHGVNVLFCERNLESIMEQIQYLMDRPKLFKTLSANGRKFAEQHHDINKVAEQYRTLFSNYFNENNQ